MSDKIYELWAMNQAMTSGYKLSTHNTSNEANEEMDKWVLADEGIFDSDAMKDGTFVIYEKNI